MFYHALRDTLVAEDLEQATRIGLKVTLTLMIIMTGTIKTCTSSSTFYTHACIVDCAFKPVSQ